MGLGDGIGNHTAKWLQPGRGVSESHCMEIVTVICIRILCIMYVLQIFLLKLTLLFSGSEILNMLQGQETSPLEFIQSSEPIKVDGLVVASHGSDDPALGCPVEYISLKGTTR